MSDEDGDAVGTAAKGEESSADVDKTDECETPPDEPSADGTDADSAPEDDAIVTEIDSIVAEIDDADVESIAEEIATLRETTADLEAERDDIQADRDDLESRLKRKQADFQNYKKRQKKRREKERARATEALVEELLEVRDNLGRALEQDESADIREGVRATFRQLNDVLDTEGVEPVEPEPGTPTDPARHEVLLRVESDRPAGTVDDVHRPGYEMGDKVLRPAQVTVSDGPSADDDPADDTATEEMPDDDLSDDSPTDERPPDGASSERESRGTKTDDASDE